MKNTLLIMAILFTAFSFAQTIKATTEAGKQVILKSDNTWLYAEGSQTEVAGCDLGEDFSQSKVNKGLLKHVMVDTDSDAADIIFMKSNASLGGGNWLLCVKGQKMTYKRVGSVFMRGDDKPY